MKERRCNSTAIREYNQQLIFDVLGRHCDGDIAIVWDRLLVRQLGMLVSPRVLSEKYKVMQNLSLDKSVVVKPEICHVIYFVASLVPSVEKLIRNYPNSDSDGNPFKKFHVYFIPEPNYVLIERLKAVEKIWHQIGYQVSSIPCHWFPSDQPNMVHMSLPQLPARMFIDGDWNFLHKCAVALHQFKQQLIGEGRHLTIYCKGVWSERVVEMLKRMEDQSDDDHLSNGNTYEPSVSSPLLDIDSIVIMDRWLDVLTPMLTQFTFGGAIDELFEIDVNGKTGPLLLNQEKPQSATCSKEIDAKDEGILLQGEVYEQLQDLHLNAIAGQIKQVLKELHEEEQMLKSLSTISDLKNCVGRIQEILTKRKWTETFLRIAEIIQRKYSENFFMEVVTCEQDILNNAQTSNGGGGEKVNNFIENAIIDGRDPCTVLRLIALQSLASAKGLRAQVAHAYRKLFVQTYGIFSLRWWLKLQLAGIICEDVLSTSVVNGFDRRFEIRASVTNYTQQIKRHRLFHPEVDEIKCSDSAYAFNGRASLLVRYLEDGLQNNWRDFTKFEGFVCGETQHRDSFVSGASESHVNTHKVSNDVLTSTFSSFGFDGGWRKKETSEKLTPKTMLFVVGGLTRAEISAIRCLHSDKICLCSSTTIITANSLLSSFK